MAGDEPGEPLLEFLEVMRRLRTECPWKREQTHRSLARYLLEEAHETVDAIDAGARTGDWAHLREELGDLLLQVYFHAVIAEQAGEFTLDDVVRGVTEKMIRRNPHVYGDVAEQPAEPQDVTELWEAVKAEEKASRPAGIVGVTEGIAPTLSALLYADKVLERLERAGAPADVQPKSPDLGERLLALVAEAHAAGDDPEQALRDAVRRLLDAGSSDTSV